MVEDLGSQNGTRVNGQLIRQPHEVISGDQISIGRTIIRVRRTKE
jgi:pSer/pThr/pTyr-binding forkhead associated (FHA) protein